MKKKRIIYGVYGMMEYQSVVRIGKNLIKVHFADGSTTATGITPATFSSENIMMQNAIESCEDFRRGRIKRVRVIELNEEIVIDHNPTKTSESNSNSITNPGTNEDNSENAMKRIPVNDISEAREWLAEKYGVSRTLIRTVKSVKEQAERLGIEFEGLE